MKRDLIYLRTPRAADKKEFLAQVALSRALHRRWVSPPCDVRTFFLYVKRCENADFAGFLVCREADDAMVGVFNISQIFLGPFRSAYLGYYAFAPLAGQGLMKAGLRLVLKRAFGELGLHRIEANLQPENHASRELIKRCGFLQEGYSRRYLKIGGRWRDHERWALISEDWRRFHAKI